ncbi:MAG TPA: DUF6618 family protein [Nitrososphaeraceae archaeon]
MRFTCTTKEDEWEGIVSNLVKHSDSYEFWIKSRSSIMVIFGATSRGGFACIPDFKVGCHLTDLKDKFWNTEQLVGVLGEVDGLTVSTALFELADKIIM